MFWREHESCEREQVRKSALRHFLRLCAFAARHASMCVHTPHGTVSTHLVSLPRRAPFHADEAFARDRDRCEVGTRRDDGRENLQGREQLDQSHRR
jgi:hypothetical protein